MANLPDITFIGFGEAGSAFTQGWRSANLSPNIKAFDVKTDDDDLRAAKMADYAHKNIDGKLLVQDAITQSGVIFSMVTADQAAKAAANTAEYIEQG